MHIRISRRALAVLVLGVSASALAVGTWPHNTLPTHPSLWTVPTSTKTYNYTAKRYKAGNTTYTQFPLLWSWSEPGGAFRYIHYSAPYANVPSCYLLAPTDSNYCTEWRSNFEFERWTFTWSDDLSPRQQQYGGPGATQATWVYPTTQNCLDDPNDGMRDGYKAAYDNGQPVNLLVAGAVYPNVPANSSSRYESLAVYDPNYKDGNGNLINGGCRPSYDPNNANSGSTNGGYIAVIRAWDGNGPPDHTYWASDMHLARTFYCQKYFKAPEYNIEDPTAADVAYDICLTAPQVETVYQVYVWGEGGPAGCEALVYASGYPKPTTADLPESTKVKNWFRNGELRFSRYTSISTNYGPTANDSWIQACNAAFTPNVAENWFYTGVYKLDQTYYQDWGDIAAASKYIAGSCPAGWTSNAAGSCDPHEGADANTNGTCPAGYTPIAYSFAGSSKLKCMQSYP